MEKQTSVVHYTETNVKSADHSALKGNSCASHSIANLLCYFIGITSKKSVTSIACSVKDAECILVKSWNICTFCNRNQTKHAISTTNAHYQKEYLLLLNFFVASTSWHNPSVCCRTKCTLRQTTDYQAATLNSKIHVNEWTNIASDK